MVRWSVCAVCVLLAASVWGQGSSEPTNSQDEELQRLRERVAALEKLVQILQAELAALKSNGAAPPSGTQLVAIKQQADEEKQKLEEELKRELQQQPIPSPAPRPSSPPSYGAVVFGGGFWQVLNPDASVIANFRTAFRGKRPFASFAGSELSEAELAFQAATDPFSRLDTFIAVGPHGTEIEEATLSVLDPTFLRLPRNLQIRLGLLRAPFGQLNNIHPPEQPFVDTPLVHRLWFGHEHGNNHAHEHNNSHENGNGHENGDEHENEHEHEVSPEQIPTEGSFVGTGLSLNWLVPTGRHLTWLTVAPLNVDNPTFHADSGRPAWLFRLRHMRELSLTQSLNLGLNYAFGRNDLGKDTKLLGVDVTYRWRPIKEGLYRSLVWQTEAYWGWRDTGNGEIKPKGWFTLVEYQLSRTLFLGARYEFAQAPDKSFSGRGFSLAITLFPSEFGRYRLQWSRLKIGGQTVHEVWLQTTFSIGIHRPHPL
ncbi:MAG: hypothetical protein DFNUSKGM_002696 [Candidatus Fervidibacter sacchari]